MYCANNLKIIIFQRKVSCKQNILDCQMMCLLDFLLNRNNVNPKGHPGRGRDKSSQVFLK